MLSLRIHEVTQNLENDVKAALGSKLDIINTNLSTSEKLSSTDRYEILHRAQEVVNSVQIQKLSKIIDIMVEEIFSEQYPKFFIIVDRLDEN